MINKETRRLFGVKDIVEISGLNRNKIYYYARTRQNLVPDLTISRRDLYSAKALLDFCLIAELEKRGMQPLSVEEIVWPGRDISTEAGDTILYSSIWDKFFDDRWKYEHQGYFLIYKKTRGERGPLESWHEGTSEELEKRVREFGKDSTTGDSLFILNLLAIIHWVEEKVGEELG